MNKKVYIIILNWNGWKDTIECLESVFRNQYNNYKVIVCDNASSDSSLEKIKQWADGKLQVHTSGDSRIDIHIDPPIEKPIEYIEYTREQAISGVGIYEPPLILIQTGGNLGFAGGNNVGIRYALARDSFAYIWLLNNDTVIKSDALIYLIKEMHERPSAGICGSTLLYYHKPDKVQALGGAKYNKWLGKTKHIGAFITINDMDLDKLEYEKMDYIVGASMLVTKQFVKDIGLLSEDYFLYFEEVDWAIRAQKYYTLAYAPMSVVFHKEGASIGSNSTPKKKSFIADNYSLKNRIIFTRKFYYRALPFIYISLLIAIINRIWRGQWNRVKMIFEIMVKT